MVFGSSPSLFAGVVLFDGSGRGGELVWGGAGWGFMYVGFFLMVAR